MNPKQYCQQKAASSGSSFYYSFLFLPPLKRQAIMALYAFCREVDDIVDECQDVHVARTKLNWWRAEITRVYEHQGTHPVAIALQDVVSVFELEQSLFIDIIDGMEMDIDISRYPTWDELATYCYRAAGVVGLLTVRILGFQDEQTFVYAKHLGMAVQLINIIRDVGEDARRGRIYLPLNELDRYDINPELLLSGQANDQLAQCLALQAQRARDYYQQAMDALPNCDRAAQSVGLMMARIYLQLLHEIEKTGFDVMGQRISLTPLRKIWIAWRTYRHEKKWVRQHKLLINPANPL